MGKSLNKLLIATTLKNSGQKEYSTSMQCSVFNLPFQIAIYQPILTNNWNNLVHPVFTLYCDTHGTALDESNHVFEGSHQASIIN